MKTFLTADLHIGHRNILRYTRPQFETIEEHDEALVQNWNSVVQVQDKVYVLGDFTVNPKYIKVGLRLNGRKVLIKGNHDNGKLHQYGEVFTDVRGSWVLDNLVLTHIPVHPAQLVRWRGNVHGHLHTNRVMEEHVYDNESPFMDKRYMCVSCEQTNLRPINFDEVQAYFKGA